MRGRADSGWCVRRIVTKCNSVAARSFRFDARRKWAAMSMVSLFRRPAQVFVLSLSLTACSTDDLSPPARIDSSARVSAIQPVRDQARGRRETAYPSAETPVGTFSENSDGAVPVDPRMQTSERLPMVDSIRLRVTDFLAGSTPVIR